MISELPLIPADNIYKLMSIELQNVKREYLKCKSNSIRTQKIA
jgi:hypothetical protein